MFYQILQNYSFLLRNEFGEGVGNTDSGTNEGSESGEKKEAVLKLGLQLTEEERAELNETQRLKDLVLTSSEAQRDELSKIIANSLNPEKIQQQKEDFKNGITLNAVPIPENIEVTGLEPSKIQKVTEYIKETNVPEGFSMRTGEGRVYLEANIEGEDKGAYFTIEHPGNLGKTQNKSEFQAWVDLKTDWINNELGLKKGIQDTEESPNNLEEKENNGVVVSAVPSQKQQEVSKKKPSYSERFFAELSDGDKNDVAKYIGIPDGTPESIQKIKVFQQDMVKLGITGAKGDVIKVDGHLGPDTYSTIVQKISLDETNIAAEKMIQEAKEELIVTENESKYENYSVHDTINDGQLPQQESINPIQEDEVTPVDNISEKNEQTTQERYAEYFSNNTNYVSPENEQENISNQEKLIGFSDYITKDNHEMVAQGLEIDLSEELTKESFDKSVLAFQEKYSDLPNDADFGPKTLGKNIDVYIAENKQEHNYEVKDFARTVTLEHNPEWGKENKESELGENYVEWEFNDRTELIKVVTANYEGPVFNTDGKQVIFRLLKESDNQEKLSGERTKEYLAFHKSGTPDNSRNPDESDINAGFEEHKFALLVTRNGNMVQFHNTKRGNGALGVLSSRHYGSDFNKLPVAVEITARNDISDGKYNTGIDGKRYTNTERITQDQLVASAGIVKALNLEIIDSLDAIINEEGEVVGEYTHNGEKKWGHPDHFNDEIMSYFGGEKRQERINKLAEKFGKPMRNVSWMKPGDGGLFTAGLDI